MSESLHPNLARIAAAYDLIQLRFDSGELDAVAARAEMANLMARDDHGVSWRIHPDTGQWERQTLQGRWVADRPPTWGLATMHTHDVVVESRTPDPSVFVNRQRVDEARTLGADPLAGASRRAAPDQRGARKLWRSWTLRTRVVVVALVVGGLALLGGSLAGGPPPATPGDGASTTVPALDTLPTVPAADTSPAP